MEGTNLQSSGASIKGTTTADELEKDFGRLFRETKGRVFVSWSSTNIDRTVTLYKACKDNGRILVPDIFCMMVLMQLGKFEKDFRNQNGKHIHASRIYQPHEIPGRTPGERKLLKFDKISFI
jgi:mRNA degradation ribonuclease J1/J2